MGIDTSERLIELHNVFLNELGHTYNIYLSEHLTGNLQVNKNWERDKKSLIIFTHAAFENYIEMLSLIILEDALYKYRYKREVSDTLLFFIWSKSNKKPDFNTDEWDENNRYYLKKELCELEIGFKNEINKNNHGIKIKNLNNLLRTVGLDLSSKDYLRSALNELTNLRGEFAHRFLVKGTKALRLTNVKGPEDIQKTVINSYRLIYRLYLSSLVKINDEITKKQIMIELINQLCISKNEKEKKLSASSLFSPLVNLPFKTPVVVNVNKNLSKKKRSRLKKRIKRKKQKK